MARIVIIEDDAAVRHFLQDILAAAGHRVIAVGSVGTAWYVLRGADVDLVVIDLMLRELSGIELAEELACSEQGDVPRIAISASRTLLRVASESEYFVECIAKPFAIDGFLAAVDRWIDAGVVEIPR